MDYGLDLSDLNQENVRKIKKMMRLAEHKCKMPPMYEILLND